MDQQTMMIGIQSLSVFSGGAFVMMWVRGVNKKLMDLSSNKLDKIHFEDHKVESNTVRIARDKERDDVIKDIKNLYDRKHIHGVDCRQENCNAKTGGMIIQ